MTASERAELTRLRRENAKLKVERQILKIGGLLRDGVDEVGPRSSFPMLAGRRWRAPGVAQTAGGSLVSRPRSFKMRSLSGGYATVQPD